jgi:hypothetical protein
MAGSVFIPLVSVFDPKGINQAKSGMASLAASLKSLKGAAVGAAASFAAVGAVGFVKETVTAARDLERNMVGLNNVFGELTPRMKGFSKDAASIGLSQVEASKASTFLGSVLKQSGFEMGVVATETENLVGLAADLSATYGYDLSEALTGMTALFRGEYDPIEKFGVAMKQSEVNALLAARGQDKLTGATLRQAQAQARLDILYARSQDAQGAYAQQSGSLFVVQTQLKAGFDNLKASLGAELTSPLASFLSNFVPVLDKMSVSLIPLFENLGQVLESIGPSIAAKADNVLTLVEALNPLINVLTDLVTPLLYPLAEVFQILSDIIKPFIPLITFLANLLGAVLAPVVTFVTFVFKLLAYTIGQLIDFVVRLFSWIPGLDGLFRNAGKGLQSFTDDFHNLNDMMGGTETYHSDLTAQLSKKINGNPIDGFTAGVEDAGDALQKASSKLSDFLQNALNIQKSIIDSANITGLIKENSNEVFQSIVYLEGKFKTVAFSAAKGASDIAGSFKDKLNKIKVFYSNLRKLTKAGLDPMLIEQIVSAGPEAGNATAEAILESGKTGIKGLNRTAKDIKKVAGDIGVLGATAMEKAGSKLGNGLIDGLYAQQDKMIADAAAIGSAVGESLADAAAAKLKTVIAEAGAAGFLLTDAEKLKSDPNYKPKKYVPKPKKIIPRVGPAISSMPQFVGSYAAGVRGAGLDGGFKLMESEDIVNPFAKNTVGYSTFKENQAIANDYNISINVGPGASPAQIGDALVKSIMEYERVKGKGWRN